MRLLLPSILVLLLAPAADARPPRKASFGDVPVDRFIRGRILEMNGRKIRILYDFEDPEQAKDFYYNRPFQREGRGSFEVAGGLLRGSGGGGLCTIMAFESDIAASAMLRLERPVRDAGLYLRDHRGTLRATIFALRETFFSRKDNQALGMNRIIAIGSVPSSMKGATEYRYVAASGEPEVVEGALVPVTLVRDGKHNTMTAGKEKFAGNDVGRPHGDVEVGFFTNGGCCFFDDLLIGGEISEGWLRDRRVAMFLSKDLTNPANRLKKRDRAALTLKRDFEAGKGSAAEILEAITDEKMIVFIREALADMLAASPRVAEAIEGLDALLRADSRATRSFASRILTRAVDLDFGYYPDGDQDDRDAAADRFTDYVANREEREANGQAFVGGAWRTPKELGKMRLTWEHAREIRTHHFFLRTNLPPKLANDKADLLEAAYDAFRKHLGREPDPAKLPLRVHLFSSKKDYETWCKRNDHGRWARYYRLILGEERLGLATWEFQQNEGILNVAARLYLRATDGFVMPLWYEEGYAMFFSAPGTYTWIRGKLIIGKTVAPNDLAFLGAQVGEDHWYSVLDLIDTGTGELREKLPRRMFYLESWSLFTFLNQSEKHNGRYTEFVMRCRAANLQEDTRRRLGAVIFAESFEGKLMDLEADWIAWIKAL